MLEITSRNILGWLRLISDVYPLEDEDKMLLDRYINRTDKMRRKKELEEIFGGEEQW